MEDIFDLLNKVNMSADDDAIINIDDKNCETIIWFSFNIDISI